MIGSPLMMCFPADHKLSRVHFLFFCLFFWQSTPPNPAFAVCFPPSPLPPRIVGRALENNDMLIVHDTRTV